MRLRKITENSNWKKILTFWSFGFILSALWYYCTFCDSMWSSPIQNSSSGNNRGYRNADTRFSANVWSKMEVFSDQLSRKRVFTALGAIVGCFGKQTGTTAGFWENQLLLFLSFRHRVHIWKELKKGDCLKVFSFGFWRKMWKSQF